MPGPSTPRRAEPAPSRARREGQHADQGGPEYQDVRAEGGDERAEAGSGHGGRGNQPMFGSYDVAVDLSTEPENSDVKSQASSPKGEANPRPFNYAKYLRFPGGKDLQSFITITY